MPQKKALITGITGQDGAYLAQFLLTKGYKVFGSYRRTSTSSFWRLEELGIRDQVNLVCMEMLDTSSIEKTVLSIRPDEIYNLAAQSFVPTSFSQPLYTGDLDGLSVTRFLNILRDHAPETRFYQASTSEMFGQAKEAPQTETTVFCPRSPYGCAKVYAHFITLNYRESANLFACSGILFNHESPLRGLEFVTRKITLGLASILAGKQACLELGNLDAKRDWGFAGDYVEGMWAMLQQADPDDYVLATGKVTSIRDFVNMAAESLNTIIDWEGKGVEEIGVERKTGKVWIRVNPAYYRPTEIDTLVGNPAKAKEKMGWEAKTPLSKLAPMMVEADLRRMGISL